ncbi:MAG: methyltransferase domain-containing protein [bacterium]
MEEIRKGKSLRVIDWAEDFAVFEYPDNFAAIFNLRSVQRAYVILEDERYHPTYLSKHKSVLKNLIDVVLGSNEDAFKSFKINCAGSDSLEVRNIASYVRETFKLEEAEEADLKIHIIKRDDKWEVGVQMTPRPLSLRDYRVMNMKGGMDPTIAYAMNSLGNLEDRKSYLNIFSGSGTLLIEAGLCYQNLEQLIGFDNDKEHLSLSIQNIKKAGLIRRVQVLEKNVLDKPVLGKFDVIASDLPFGMSILKGQDLESLYRAFIECSKENLEPDGLLVAYTSEYELLRRIISGSNFKILKTLELKFITNANSYLRTKIFVCRLKGING